MPLFDAAPGLSSIGSVAKTLGSGASSVLSSVGTVGKIAGALNNLSNPAALVSALRGINLPSGGNTGSTVFNAGAQFSGSDAGNDWRVRLSIPTTPIYTNSPILQPLKKAGGLVFPYTPTVSITHTAVYGDEPITHQNYSFIYYQNSRASDININGAFHVEDSIQAQYWIAVIHYLRSVTKMFTGDLGDISGNPPPLVFLNGYGDFVFKNIPVIVKSFTVDLPADVNYIATSAGQEGSTSQFGQGSGAGSSTIESLANTAGVIGGVLGAVGAGKASQLLGAVGSAAGIVNGVKNLLAGGTGGGSGGGGGGAIGAGSNGASHVPTKSNISVTVQPIYSRESVRKFNLKDFVNGDLVNNIPGHV